MDRRTGRLHLIKIVENIKHFRLPFYRKLEGSLDSLGIDFSLYYSEAIGAEARKGDAVPLPEGFAQSLPARHLGPLLTQSLPWRAIRRADGVIAVRANRLTQNYPLMVLRRTTGLNLAWWGHAYNYQGKQDSLAEKLKRRLAREANWWFSYMPESRGYLAGLGFDPDRITVVENTIDVSEFDNTSMLEARADALRRKWQLPADAVFGIFSGSLYADKMLDFLLAALEVARQVRPDLHLILIGNGPMRPQVEAWASSNSWVHYFGSRYREEKAELFAVSKMTFNPGLVGLGIIDTFASGRPLVTTDCGFHSPEIGYLKPGQNGVMVAPLVQDYGQAIVELLGDPARLKTLISGARTSAREHTLDRMVEGVADGVRKWLRAG